MPESVDIKSRILDYLKKNGKSSVYDIWIGLHKEINLSGLGDLLGNMAFEGEITREGDIVLPAKYEDEDGNPLYAPDMFNDPNYFETYSYGIPGNKPSVRRKKTKKEKTPSGRVPLQYYGHDVPRCFSVGSVAMSFISALDSVSSPSAKNISMLGVFAKWGRGKSYFFNVVESILSARKSLINNVIGYDIVEFNAWKYQSIPAIWASLFDTLLNKKSKWFRLRFSIKRNLWPFLRGVLICLAIPGIFFLLSTLYNPTDLSKPSAFAQWLKNGHIVQWSGVFSIAFFILNFLAEHLDSFQSIIKNKRKSLFYEHLGVQADIEKALTSLLTTWIRKKNTDKQKVVLYVEDVDRCESDKMLGIIESLRTVLEQPEIRERLIVVISIDHELLWRAIEHKYKDTFCGDELTAVVKNSFDKLFVSSITLPELNQEKEFQFLDTLIFRERATIEEPSFRYEPGTLDAQALKSLPNRDDAILIRDLGLPNVEDKTKEHKRIIDSLFISNIKNTLENNPELHLTPRQLSCIYYRTLLAFDLLSSLRDYDSIDSKLVDQIVIRSYSNNKQMYEETLFEDVLKMVIPYPDFVSSPS